MPNMRGKVLDAIKDGPTLKGRHGGGALGTAVKAALGISALSIWRFRKKARKCYNNYIIYVRNM